MSASVLMMIARWNSPFAAGNAVSIAVFPPPPDCPKIVTFRGSPPNRATLSRTHSRAATRSSSGEVRGAREALARAGQPGKPQVAERIQPVIDADGDDVVLARELGAIIEDRVSRSRALAAAMEPHHHRPLSAPVDGVHRFRLRQSSSIGPLPVSASPISGIIGRNGCQARGPYSNASRTPVHGVGFAAGRNPARRRLTAVAQTLEGVNTVVHESPDLAVRGLDDGLLRRRVCPCDGQSDGKREKGSAIHSDHYRQKAAKKKAVGPVEVSVVTIRCI